MSAAVHLILLTLIAYAFSDPDRNPDCRKFVFAPICRGVAAKRNQPNKAPTQSRNGYLVDANKLKELLKGYNIAEWMNDESNQVADIGLPNRPNRRQSSADPPSFYDYDHV